jgi:hypothetical protein
MRLMTSELLLVILYVSVIFSVNYLLQVPSMIPLYIEYIYTILCQRHIACKLLTTGFVNTVSV